MASKTIRTILVGVATPDDRSQPAIQRAATLAAALRAKLILFHSAFESYSSGRPFFDSARLAKSRGELVATRLARLRSLCSQLERGGVTARAAVVWEEPVWAAVTRAAIRDDADLIVVGAHRPRANRTPVLKQNDWELMRHCARPLLIVRTTTQPSGPVVAAVDPTHHNDKPATLDIELAKVAATLAAGFNTECHVAHCISDGAFPLGLITMKERQRMRRDLQTTIGALLDKAAVDAAKIHLVDGLVEDALPALVKKLGASTLVLGALSRRGFKGFVVGNTAERLIHETTCDLLIVKPPGFKARAPRARKEPIELPA